MAKANFKICYGCGLAQSECFCQQINQLDLVHKIVLINTGREKFIRSNTGRLIKKSLLNYKEITMGGLNWETEVESEINESHYTPVLFYPYPSAVSSKDALAIKGLPLKIFIFDTSWKTSRKWIYKKIFENIQKVELKLSYDSVYELRKSPAKNYLCSLQALACLFGEMDSVETDKVKKDLMSVLDYVVQKMKEERGIYQSELKLNKNSNVNN